MPLLYEARDDTAHVEVDGELTIYTVADLGAQLLPRLGGTPRLALDLSQVTEMDGAGLQWLMLIQREAPRAGTQLTVSGQSKAVVEVLALCNLVA